MSDNSSTPSISRPQRKIPFVRIFTGVCLIILLCLKIANNSDGSERWKTPRFWWNAVQQSEVVSPYTEYGRWNDDMQFWTLYIPDSSTSSDFETAAQFVLDNFSSNPDDPAYVERISIRTDSCLDTDSQASKCKALIFYNENMNAKNVAAGVAALKHFESPLWTGDNNAEVFFTAVSGNAADAERLSDSGSVIVRTGAEADVTLWNDAGSFVRDGLPGYSVELLSANVMVGYTTDFISAEQLKSTDLTATISARSVVADRLNLNNCHVKLHSGESKVVVLCDPGTSKMILPDLQVGDERLKAVRDAVTTAYPGVSFEFVADPAERVGVPTSLDTRF